MSIVSFLTNTTLTRVAARVARDDVVWDETGRVCETYAMVQKVTASSAVYTSHRGSSGAGCGPM